MYSTPATISSNIEIVCHNVSYICYRDIFRGHPYLYANHYISLSSVNLNSVAQHKD